MKVYTAIAAVAKAMSHDGIGKGRKNLQQGYNFRGIDDVLNALSSALTEAGLVILPRVTSRECVERTSAKGGALFFVAVHVDFDLVAVEDGSKHTVTTYGEAMDSADKATNKAMSAAYKYLALLTFCIPTEATPENDADFTTHDVRPKGVAPARGPAEEHEPVDTERNFGLSAARYKVVRGVANAALQSFNEGRELDAYGEVSAITDNDEKLALWSILKPHSALRSAMKRLHDEEAAAQAKLDGERKAA
jgi:hypothetical protein